MQTSRVPDFPNKTREGMSIWFAEMALRDLLFHPEDAPETIVRTAMDKPTFTPDECVKLDDILADMFDRFGDGVCEAAHPVFMRQMGLRPAA